MITVYVVNTPPTLVSFITQGEFPQNIPSWVESKKIICHRDKSECLKSLKRITSSIFIVKLKLPELICNNNSANFELKNINTTCIQKIYVANKTGFNVATKIIKDRSDTPIVIKPDLYPPPSQGIKRKRQDHSTELSNIKRISSQQEHIDVLRRSLLKAQSSILITSYSINDEMLQQENIYDLFYNATLRNVKIYCYVCDEKQIPDHIKATFARCNVKLSVSYSHSKILAVDKNYVAIGSFNWLSDFNSRYEFSANGSLVCQGDYCRDLIEDLWRYLKHSRNIQYGNFGLVKRFEKNHNHYKSYKISQNSNSELTYLTNLEQYQEFFLHSFYQAKKRLIICSPFLSFTGGLIANINADILNYCSTKPVTITFVCNGNDKHLIQFQEYVKSLNMTNIQVITAQNFHLKTIIIDEEVIAEGSFNWLSAANNKKSQFHNHEVTLVASGTFAKGLIDSFFATQFGSMLSYQLNKQEVVDTNYAGQSTTDSTHINDNSQNDDVWSRLLTGALSVFSQMQEGFSQTQEENDIHEGTNKYNRPRCKV